MPLSQSALITKLNTYAPLTSEEIASLTEVQSKPIVVRRGKELFHEGQHGQMVFIVQRGWASSYKDVPDGGRQIINFAIPGDCVGLRSVLLKESDHAFSALTDSTLRTIDAVRMTQLFEDFPRLRAGFLWSAARDEAMALEHLVGIGRRSAISRVAHFFLELAERLTLVGLATETQFHCPLNQYVLGDALGLSAIHVNRVLRGLRERGLLTVKSGVVLIHDLQGLGEIANYHSLNPRSQVSGSSQTGPPSQSLPTARLPNTRSDN